MLIVETKSGKLANRMVIFSHFIASAIENNYLLINPTFHKFSGYFPAIRQNNFFGHSISTLRFVPYKLIRLLGKIGRTLVSQSPWHRCIICQPGVSFDLSQSSFLQEVTKKLLIAHGWGFRDYVNVQKHVDAIRLIFKPDNIIEQRVSDFVGRVRQSADYVVGVHVRRSDYRTWKNGKYFFDNETYLNLMLQMQTQLKGNVKFVLCSGESLDMSDFNNVQAVFSNGDEIADLYTLCRCDYLIGPPSTYSSWASFYGDVPLLHIYSKGQHFTLDEFKISTL